jgi:organic hydroperoxide reductase OsmC/OhrA
MHPYPHTYVASASAQSTGLVAITSPPLPSLETAPPAQFDGPGDVWSPETLLCASLADCFVLTFRAVSRAARFKWLSLECRVEGVLERVGQAAHFTRYTTFAKLRVSAETDAANARELLDRAEQGCLIANSLSGARALEAEVLVANSAIARPQRIGNKSDPNQGPIMR